MAMSISLYDSSTRPNSGAASLGPALESAVASLPASFLINRSTADVAVVDGSHDWVIATTAALRSGARGVMIVGPRRAEPEELIDLAALAEGQRAPIVCAYLWASNPLVAVVKELWPDAAGPSDFVELTADLASSSHERQSALVDQLMLVGTIFGKLVEVRLIRRTHTGYVVSGEIAVRDGRLPVSIIASTGTAGRGEVSARRMSLTHRAEIVIPFPNDARPARARLITESEEFNQPLIYENSLRSSMLRLSGLIGREGGFGDDVRRLEQLCEVLGDAWEFDSH